MKALRLDATWDPRPDYRPSPAELAQKKATVASKVWRHPTLAQVQVPDPSPQPGQVVVEVRVCGVCGSDTHCVETDDQGYIRFSGPTALPCILGHEYAGEVVAVGQGVRHLQVGDLVTAEGMLYCGSCDVCRRGAFNQCPHLEMVGFSAPGAMAERIAVHEKHCFSLNPLAERLGDPKLALERAALVEPVGCAFNGMFVVAGGILPGAHVAVFGLGPIGLGAVALARAAGAATVCAFDPIGERREIGAALGAQVFAPTGAAQTILAHTHGAGADMIVEAAGALTHTMPEIEGSLAAGGTMVYLGRTGEQTPLTMDILVSGAMRIVGARGHAGGGVFPHILRLLEHQRIDLDPMITCRLPMASAQAALTRSTMRTDGKILLLA